MSDGMSDNFDGTKINAYERVNKSQEQKLSDDQIKYMVERFLFWRLPENFNPDAGISFKREFNEHTAHPMKHEPIGTNLFDYTQAEAMIRYLVDGMPTDRHESAQPSPTDVGYEYLQCEPSQSRLNCTANHQHKADCYEPRVAAAQPEAGEPRYELCTNEGHICETNDMIRCTVCGKYINRPTIEPLTAEPKMSRLDVHHWLNEQSSKSGWNVGRFIQFAEEQERADDLADTLLAFAHQVRQEAATWKALHSDAFDKWNQAAKDRDVARAEIARLTAERDVQHHPFCNFSKQKIGGEGCICVVTYRKGLIELEHAEDTLREARDAVKTYIPESSDDVASDLMEGIGNMHETIALALKLTTSAEEQP